MSAFTRVNLLTGFLGSGKTTLLRRILQDPALAGAAVLINEFGEVGLDHHLIERIDEGTVLLQSGCLCCTIRGELSEAIRDLHSRRERGLVPAFDRLLIESTGLADPFPILSTIQADPVVSHHFRAGNIVATVDAVNAPDEIDRRNEMIKQIAAADRIFVTKTDLVPREAAAALFARLAAMNPAAEIRDVHDPNWDAGWLVREEPGAVRRRARADPADLDDDDLGRHGSIQTFSITLDRPIDWTAFGIWLTMLLNRHGPHVLRVKGILDLVGEERPVAVHGVQRLVHPPTHMSAWPTDDRRSHIVFIVDGLDPGRIIDSLAAFTMHEMETA